MKDEQNISGIQLWIIWYCKLLRLIGVFLHRPLTSQVRIWSRNRNGEREKLKHWSNSFQKLRLILGTCQCFQVRMRQRGQTLGLHSACKLPVVRGSEINSHLEFIYIDVFRISNHSERFVSVNN